MISRKHLKAYTGQNITVRLKNGKTVTGKSNPERNKGHMIVDLADGGKVRIPKGEIELVATNYRQGGSLGAQSQPNVSSVTQEPVKRKRGRPCKVVPVVVEPPKDPADLLDGISFTEAVAFLTRIGGNTGYQCVGYDRYDSDSIFAYSRDVVIGLIKRYGFIASKGNNSRVYHMALGKSGLKVKFVLTAVQYAINGGCLEIIDGEGEKSETIVNGTQPYKYYMGDDAIDLCLMKARGMVKEEPAVVAEEKPMVVESVKEDIVEKEATVEELDAKLDEILGTAKSEDVVAGLPSAYDRHRFLVKAMEDLREIHSEGRIDLSGAIEAIKGELAESVKSL